MRKLVQIVLLIIYFCFNAGMSYSMHYCGEELARINFFAEEKNCCPDGDEMPGCCDDVPKTELQNSDQSLAKLVDMHFYNASLLPLPDLMSEILVCLAQQTEKYPTIRLQSEAPPSLVPIHIKHQTFLI
ncbi:hypothetical protein DN752_18155 [Echinicola strongylocentroti]|uniref:Uncharacterized protein n=1 Tax=Echinicola strongylocentroti TaxID=1795355 RepID=A0A2Z4ILY1_9BACT|nr:hypothetical protein [Echinicola strongylocentroti]AWW31904.1 hypothetical protein DN752_18155 [Echinicola strongylocentroti]